MSVRCYYFMYHCGSSFTMLPSKRLMMRLAYDTLFVLDDLVRILTCGGQHAAGNGQADYQ